MKCTCGCHTCECDKKCNIARQNTPDEAIKVLQAFKEGKVLEMCLINRISVWRNRVHDMLQAFPSFNDFQYRIKEEPKILYSCFKNGNYIQSFTEEIDAKEYCDQATVSRLRTYYKMI